MNARWKSYKNIPVIIGLFLSCILFGQTKVNYVPTSSVIANPERGWYDDYYSYSGSSNLSGNYKPLHAQELITNRDEDKITLILRLFYLHEFLEQESVSAAYISKMQNDFDSIRKAGVKCIVRFAYSASQNADVWDATPDKVFSHIESLRDVLSENGDIIAGVQAGFIGAWGEWYYTKNFAGQGYRPDETDQENRRLLVEALLDILPGHIAVQGRTPSIMKNIVQTDDPISEEEAFSGTIKSRVGHHNDCFLANASDYGTYTNLEEDLAYLHESTKYTITGGETCDASNSTSDCVEGVPRMKELHWTYLNRDYNKAVYDKWKAQGCYNEVNIFMGYRIRLDSAIFPDSVDKGALLQLTFNFMNEGFAAPTHYKPIQIALTDVETGEDFLVDYSGSNDDIRHWLPGLIISEGTITIPEEIQDGYFRIGLRFHDQSPGLADNPAYSIQLANAGIWDTERGINDLSHMIRVGTPDLERIQVKKPIDVNASAQSDSAIDLWWTEDSENETGFELMRSWRESGIWIHIDTLKANSTDYNDGGLDGGTKYSYILRAFNSYGNSPWSEPVSATTEGIASIRGISDLQSFDVYPNPLNGGELIINFSDDSEKQLVIRGISGQIVIRETINSKEIHLDKDLFNPGMYIITVKLNTISISRKLMVL